MEETQAVNAVAYRRAYVLKNGRTVLIPSDYYEEFEDQIRQDESNLSDVCNSLNRQIKTDWNTTECHVVVSQRSK